MRVSLLLSVFRDIIGDVQKLSPFTPKGRAVSPVGDKVSLEFLVDGIMANRDVLLVKISGPNADGVEMERYYWKQCLC